MLMRQRLPSWFKQRPNPQAVAAMEGLLDSLSLHTICESAHCPNAGDCFSRKTATFLILGNICTRNCRFCAVDKGHPLPVDEAEPGHLLAAVETLSLRYVVITSVTRDDLPDGGAAHFARTVSLLREKRPGIMVEVLVPDFLGSQEALSTVVAATPSVINHNVETVPRLYPEVRQLADYRRSVRLLGMVKELDPTIVTKSGLMLGLGETKAEVVAVMQDLREVGCDLLTLGQYLPPSPQHYPLARYLSPEEFAEFETIGKSLGFAEVASAPLVRSSFRAAELYAKAKS
jgi:lipoic acid synthetase